MPKQIEKCYHYFHSCVGDSILQLDNIFLGIFSDILFNILPLMEPLLKCLELTLESKTLVNFHV